MRTFLSNSNFNFVAALCSLFLLILFSSCEKESLPVLEDNILDAKAQNNEKEGSDDDFQSFHQSFNNNTDAWADQYVEGVLGWCGTIELWTKKTGEVMPSKGNGYATVMWGECNTFWSEEADEEGLPTFQYGAPATQDPDLWSATWPSSGFIQNLDIYLDPAMFDNGVAFTYSNSLKLQGEMAFIYFAFDVVKDAGSLYINDFEVSEAGWYTFSYVYGEDEGKLLIDFQLLQKNQLLYSFPIEKRLYAPEVSTSDLWVDDYGSGYIWFVYLQDGVALPIDEQMLRAGK